MSDKREGVLLVLKSRAVLNSQGEQGKGFQMEGL